MQRAAAQATMSDLDGLRDMLEAVAVSRETDAKIKGTVPPVGAALGAGGTVQVPPTRHGDPISLTGACDTFVTLALLSARQGEDREGRQFRSNHSPCFLLSQGWRIWKHRQSGKAKTSIQKCCLQAKITPRSPHRRGRLAKQAKDRQADRLGSWLAC